MNKKFSFHYDIIFAISGGNPDLFISDTDRYFLDEISFLKGIGASVIFICASETCGGFAWTRGVEFSTGGGVGGVVLNVTPKSVESEASSVLNLNWSVPVSSLSIMGSTCGVFPVTPPSFSWPYFATFS